MSAPAPTLTFGRYRGLPLSQVPVGYLNWAIDKGRLPLAIEAAVRMELRLRAEMLYGPIPGVEPLIRRDGSTTKETTP